MWSAWTEGGPTGERYNTSRSGWFDSTCFEDWFETLVLPRLKKQEGRKVLIGDNLSSHINLSVIDKCRENNIAFISLVPNSTHLMQPLDIAYFHPMKVEWRKQIGTYKSSQNGAARPLSKDVFPSMLTQLVKELEHKGKENMKAGFRKAGIYPLNRNEVLSRLPSTEASATDEVSDSFIKHLEELRGNDVTEKRKKRKKIDVVPGKSVSTEDIVLKTSNRKDDEPVAGTSIETRLSMQKTMQKKQMNPKKKVF